MKTISEITSEKIFRCPVEVRGYELDSYAHVNHAVYLHYLEHARWKMLSEIGITRADCDAWKRWPVIVGLEIRYARPALHGDALEVRTRVLGRGRTTLVFEQKIYRGETLLTEAKVTGAVINEEGRAAKMPEEMSRLWI